jgi:hypothetical protein
MLRQHLRGFASCFVVLHACLSFVYRPAHTRTRVVLLRSSPSSTFMSVAVPEADTQEQFEYKASPVQIERRCAIRSSVFDTHCSAGGTWRLSLILTRERLPSQRSSCVFACLCPFLRMVVLTQRCAHSCSTEVRFNRLEQCGLEPISAKLHLTGYALVCECSRSHPYSICADGAGAAARDQHHVHSTNL